MQQAFKYKAYPSREQEQAMLHLLEIHRHLYNHALAQRKCACQIEQRTLTYLEQSAQLKTERRINPHLALANFSSCQRTLKRLHRAFQAFFRRVKSGEKPGYPRFRGYGRFDTVEFTGGDGARLIGCPPGGKGAGKVYVQNVGEIKLKLHRPMEGEIKTITFRRQADGWYVIFVCDVEQRSIESSTNPTIRIDLGLKSFLVTSEGESVDPPQLYRKAQAKLRRSQRSVARKRRGGKNRRKAVRNLARVHQHIANQRKDFHHKVALDLVGRFGKIAHEDLNVKGLAKSMLAKSVHDAGWSQFISIVSHKAESAGVEMIAVDPRQTTQTCSCCGRLPSAPIGLSVRTYTCEHCGFTLDRDWNAAINIRNRADGMVSGIVFRAGAPPLQGNVVQ